MFSLTVPPLHTSILSSGIPLRYRNTHCPDLLRVDLMIRAGSVFQQRPLVAAFTNMLLKEGCQDKTSAQIAELFDTYGAFLYYSIGMEYAYVNLLTPKKCYRQTLSLLRDIYLSPAYPQHDVKVVVEQRYHNYLVDREKVQVRATTAMNALLFGENHPYGRQLKESDFEDFDRELLLDFHRRYYLPSRTEMILVGDVGEEELAITEEIFGGQVPRTTVADAVGDLPPAAPAASGSYFIPKEDALQAALRFTFPLVGQDHPDFVPLKVLNTLLGGYYGSRLMTSIREEKAYTYGIFSSHTVYRNASYIDIETQTDIRFVKPLIAAVYEEIDRLQNEKVSEKELSILRQYLSGEFARMMDGPFTLSDLYISTASVGMPLSSLETQMQAMKEVSADDLQTLAQRYLRKESAYEVCVGGKSL